MKASESQAVYLLKPYGLTIGLFSDSAACYNAQTREIQAFSLVTGHLLEFLQAARDGLTAHALAAQLLDEVPSEEDVALVQNQLDALEMGGWVHKNRSNI